MKKCLVVLTGIMLLLLFVPTASASYILCQGVGTAGDGSVALTNQPVTLTCSSYTVPEGYTLTGVEIKLVDDAQGPGAAGSTVYFSWSSFTGVTQSGTQKNAESSTDGTTFNSCTGSGISSSCPTTLSYTESVASGDTFNAVSVTVSASGAAGTYNSHGGASAELYIQYDLTPNGTIPEPTTLSLIGGALMGLGVFARKRFSRP
jgi:hypothetical protein